MVRREVVLLVSRALALLLAIPNLISFALYFPNQVLLLSVQHPSDHPALAQAAVESFIRYTALAVLGLVLHLGAA
jgi:hypothetical protein